MRSWRSSAHASLANIDHPEKAQWAEQIDAHWRKFVENRVDLNQIIESFLDDDEWLDSDHETTAGDWSDATWSDTSSQRQEDVFLPKPQPIVSTAPRVGRNEGCPCGSGKKYKNCCMRNLPK